MEAAFNSPLMGQVGLARCGHFAAQGVLSAALICNVCRWGKNGRKGLGADVQLIGEDARASGFDHSQLQEKSCIGHRQLVLFV